MTEFRDDMPLGEARAELRLLVDDGHRCPLCTQFAKVYKRKLNSRMARALIAMYRAGGAHTYVHLPTVAGDGCEGGKLRYWGLVSEEAERRDDGGRTGWWTITPTGVRFLHGQATVEKYAHIYDGRCLRLSGPPTTIQQALGTRFNYHELMDTPGLEAAA